MSFREMMTCSRVCVYQEVRRELSTGFLTLKLFAEHAKAHLPCMATPFPNSLLVFVHRTGQRRFPVRHLQSQQLGRLRQNQERPDLATQ